MTEYTEIHSNDSFAERLKCVINSESVRGFAHRCGISEGALRNYLSGGEPTRPALIAITAATGVSLLWLASGQGPMREADKAPRLGAEKKKKDAIVETREKFDPSIFELRGGLNKELSSLVRRLLDEREQLEKQIDLLISENKELRSRLAKEDDSG